MALRDGPGAGGKEAPAPGPVAAGAGALPTATMAQAPMPPPGGVGPDAPRAGQALLWVAWSFRPALRQAKKPQGLLLQHQTTLLPIAVCMKDTEGWVTRVRSHLMVSADLNHSGALVQQCLVKVISDYKARFLLRGVCSSIATSRATGKQQPHAHTGPSCIHATIYTSYL
jgi:hypothetical protein